jgi:hypothetical protein
MKEHYNKVLLDGCAIEYKDISLCKINDYYDRIIRKELYQVHSDNRKAKFSMMYKNPHEAVDKFLEIKGKVK